MAAGVGIKDQVREAIQLLSSPQIVERTILRPLGLAQPGARAQTNARATVDGCSGFPTARESDGWMARRTFSWTSTPRTRPQPRWPRMATASRWESPP